MKLIAAVLVAVSVIAVHPLNALTQTTGTGGALEGALRQQINPAKTAGTGLGPAALINAGTVYVLQQGGLLGAPPIRLGQCPAKFQNGVLHPPTRLCTSLIGGGTRFLDKGTKVYVTKIDVNSKKNSVDISLMECDSCNGVTDPSSFKSTVSFQFDSGFLDTATPVQVIAVINQVIAADSNSSQAGSDAPSPAVAPSVAATPPPAPMPDIAPPPPPADTPPPTISEGQTKEQVVAAFGQPMRLAKLGVKEIFYYKDMKVIFTNGKVTNVE